MKNHLVKLVEYLDGFQYTGGELNFFPHAEGYVNVTLGTTGNRIFNYVYNYTDHLGNIRLSYTKDMVDNKLKILEENHYYPFGLKHQKYTAGNPIGLKAIDEITAIPNYLTSTPYNYKYNGQEWQDELGLNMYDMDMRQYDPAIARWVVLDPVIHHSMSPYNAFDNNPVFWADPSGADSVFDSLGTEVASVTNMSSGFSIGAGGKDNTKNDQSAAKNAARNGGGKGNSSNSSSGGHSQIGNMFGSEGDPNAILLPEVVAYGKGSLLAGLEKSASTAMGIWGNSGNSSSLGNFFSLPGYIQNAYNNSYNPAYSPYNPDGFAISLNLNANGFIGNGGLSIGLVVAQGHIGFTYGASGGLGFSGMPGVDGGLQMGFVDLYGGATNVMKEMAGEDVSYGGQIGPIGGSYTTTATSSGNAARQGIRGYNVNVFGRGISAPTLLGNRTAGSAFSRNYSTSGVISTRGNY